jgi:hypothetical protein
MKACINPNGTGDDYVITVANTALIASNSFTSII